MDIISLISYNSQLTTHLLHPSETVSHLFFKRLGKKNAFIIPQAKTNGPYISNTLNSNSRRLFCNTRTGAAERALRSPSARTLASPADFAHTIRAETPCNSGTKHCLPSHSTVVRFVYSLFRGSPRRDAPSIFNHLMKLHFKFWRWQVWRWRSSVMLPSVVW